MRNILRKLFWLAWLIFVQSTAASAQNFTMSATPITACAGTYYDPGGTGPYTNELEIVQTLSPATPGAKVRVVFNTFNTEYSYDVLTIYDGPSVSSPLIASFSGSAYPGTITATGSTGKLTFKFISDNAQNGTGWKATISCLTTGPATTLLMNGVNQTTCSGTWSDPGGSGPYLNNTFGTIQTFTPSTSGAKLRFTFNWFDTQGGQDFLDIYDGPSTSSPHLGGFSGQTGPGVVTATNPTGQLTFFFSSNATRVGNGWSASISCLLPNAAEPDLTTQKDDFLLGPNPTKGPLMLTFQKQEGPATISVINPLGQELFSQLLPPMCTEASLNLGQLPVGVYLVRLQFQKFLITRRVVKE